MEQLAKGLAEERARSPERLAVERAMASRPKPLGWQHQRSLTVEDFAAALNQLGLSKAAAARYFGISIRSVDRMAEGKAKIPTAIALLIFSLIYHHERPVVPKRHRKGEPGIVHKDSIDIPPS